MIQALNRNPVCRRLKSFIYSTILVLRHPDLKELKFILLGVIFAFFNHNFGDIVFLEELDTPETEVEKKPPSNIWWVAVGTLALCTTVGFVLGGSSGGFFGGTMAGVLLGLYPGPEDATNIDSSTNTASSASTSMDRPTVGSNAGTESISTPTLPQQGATMTVEPRPALFGQELPDWFIEIFLTRIIFSAIAGALIGVVLPHVALNILFSYMWPGSVPIIRSVLPSIYRIVSIFVRPVLVFFGWYSGSASSGSLSPAEALQNALQLRDERHQGVEEQMASIGPRMEEINNSLAANRQAFSELHAFKRNVYHLQQESAGHMLAIAHVGVLEAEKRIQEQTASGQSTKAAEVALKKAKEASSNARKTLGRIIAGQKAATMLGELIDACPAAHYNIMAALRNLGQDALGYRDLGLAYDPPDLPGDSETQFWVSCIVSRETLQRIVQNNVAPGEVRWRTPWSSILRR